MSSSRSETSQPSALSFPPRAGEAVPAGERVRAPRGSEAGSSLGEDRIMLFTLHLRHLILQGAKAFLCLSHT